MRWILVLSAACAPSCALLASHADDPRDIVRGPIHTRVQQPNKLTFLAFRPRRAAVVAEGGRELRATFEYSSMFENGNLGGERVVFDGEIARVAAALRTGVAPRTDLEVEVPILYAADGVLDRFVETWHEVLGFPGGGRDERERFSYEMEVEKNGQRIYQMEPYEPALGDVPVVLTHQIVTETSSTPAIAVRFGVELPVGSESKGFGNGGFDWGGGVLSEKSWGRWTMTGAVDWIDTKRPSSFVGSGVDVEDDLALQWGLEYRWNDSVSLLLGLISNRAVTDDIAIKELDSDMLSADLGVAWDVGASSTLVLGFEDDVIAESGPDFTFFASWIVGM